MDKAPPWTITPGLHRLNGPAEIGVTVTFTDPDGFTASLWLDRDALDNLRSGLDLTAVVHPRSFLQTAGDRSQQGDYEILIVEPDRLELRITRDGRRIRVDLTRREIAALSDAVTAGEQAALALLAMTYEEP
jgi:hypothetical protein